VRVGYACINRSIGCTSGRTFRLASYSEKRLVETVEHSLDCLGRLLQWNRAHGIRFFRITSDLVPFASHPVCRVDWSRRFRAQFARLGRFVLRHKMRVSLHPDQFVLLNAREERVVRSSIAELEYQAKMLDLMGLGRSAKLQVHLGAAYGDKPGSKDVFCRQYERLPVAVRRRLAVENDDRIYTVADCLEVSERTGIPVVFDVFHHKLNSSGESVAEALRKCAATWRRTDGPPMVDYSSQQPGARRGAHAEHIDLRDFRRFAAQTAGLPVDVMLESKDKEASALRAIAALA
jgi:UV DNA damage endonuclease